MTLHTILSINGYGIPKQGNDDIIFKSKSELTMKPSANFSLTSDSEKSFVIYSESEKYLYVPRHYGLQKFGLPQKCLITDGVDCKNMIFEGTLREQQLEPVENFIKCANDPLVRGGIVSVPCGFG